MNILYFRDKVVTALHKNFNKSGEIKPTFLYVNSKLEFKAVDLSVLNDEPKSYVKLFLKELCKKEKPLFTAYINHAKILNIPHSEAKKLINPNGTYKYPFLTPYNHPDAIQVVVVSINSNIPDENKYLIHFKIEDRVIVKPELKLYKEFCSREIQGMFSDLI